MALALMLARRGLGTTAPNPSVGAVIVAPAVRTVLGRGWTAPGGRPHAETIAMTRAGDAARGATLYVTLEPCSHHGATPPCADAIVEAGVRRVVVGIEDPDPRVAGRGIERLRRSGVAVDRFVRADEADWVTRGHILRVTERRPLVTVKLALTASGEAPAGTGGRPVWVTGEMARRMGHLLRAEADAILVGRRTVTDDDPDLTCRLAGAAWRSPVRVVLASNLAVPPASRLVRTARQVPVWIVAAADAPASAALRLELEAAGVQILTVGRIGGELWLPSVLEALVARGITRLLVEGGPAVWRAFDRAGLVDEAVLFHGPADNDDPPPDPIALVARHLPNFRCRVQDRRQLGDDTMVTLVRSAGLRRKAVGNMEAR